MEVGALSLSLLAISILWISPDKLSSRTTLVSQLSLATPRTFLRSYRPHWLPSRSTLPRQQIHQLPSFSPHFWEPVVRPLLQDLKRSSPSGTSSNGLIHCSMPQIVVLCPFRIDPAELESDPQDLLCSFRVSGDCLVLQVDCLPFASYYHSA